MMSAWYVCPTYGGRGEGDVTRGDFITLCSVKHGQVVCRLDELADEGSRLFTNVE